MSPRISLPFELVHSNIRDPNLAMSLRIILDFIILSILLMITRVTWVYFLMYHSNVLYMFRSFYQKVKVQSSLIIKIICTDNT